MLLLFSYSSLIISFLEVASHADSGGQRATYGPNSSSPSPTSVKSNQSPTPTGGRNEKTGSKINRHPGAMTSPSALAKIRGRIIASHQSSMKNPNAPLNAAEHGHVTMPADAASSKLTAGSNGEKSQMVLADINEPPSTAVLSSDVVAAHSAET